MSRTAYEMLIDALSIAFFTGAFLIILAIASGNI